MNVAQKLSGIYLKGLSKPTLLQSPLLHPLIVCYRFSELSSRLTVPWTNMLISLNVTRTDFVVYRLCSYHQVFYGTGCSMCSAILVFDVQNLILALLANNSTGHIRGPACQVFSHVHVYIHGWTRTCTYRQMWYTECPPIRRCGRHIWLLYNGCVDPTAGCCPPPPTHNPNS